MGFISYEMVFISCMFSGDCREYACFFHIYCLRFCSSEFIFIHRRLFFKMQYPCTEYCLFS
jgi:hypothetical protein